MEHNKELININDPAKKHQSCSVTLIHHENLSLIKNTDCPVLLARIRRDSRIMEHITLLQRVAARFPGKLDIYYSLDELLPYLHCIYHVQGTPTFLLLKKGQVKDCLLGIIDYDRLCAVLQDTFFPDSHKETP